MKIRGVSKCRKNVYYAGHITIDTAVVGETGGIKMSKIEDKVCAKIQARAETGKKKYGVTMEREDLSNEEWLIHLQEELMDASVYVERILSLLPLIQPLNEEAPRDDNDFPLL